MSTLEIIRLVRDVLFLLLLLIGVMTAVGLYLKVATLQKSISRTKKSMEEIVSALSNRFVKPAATGSAMGFGIGKVVSFLLERLREKKDDKEGEES